MKKKLVAFSLALVTLMSLASVVGAEKSIKEIPNKPSVIQYITEPDW
ncbi:hypothetical protein [Brevibacillus laterosporus]|uniref:Cyclic lactone autoinducer peptide n=1 Tax=Brevibacillus laterosporus TaxID=1465 RepID=A0AAP3GA23_BRELA|nr:hypothetical protein [Brevibacillus laterosporus]MCR8979517.1 hypothetical protein [Brevibacillus laterosporus]MCZ0806672.1 hypothetical protein [Brevibacillus laterosporus]MCZ0825120.1 hypothetical protein [Brevibacillus laterosporus]MCZ0852042.1 hypothetical protein [Brevibacillus laterosporus]